jgi:hypothetical protein
MQAESYKLKAPGFKPQAEAEGYRELRNDGLELAA